MLVIRFGRRRWRLLVSYGRELRLEGMVNVSESLVNVVTNDKLKRLIGLSQNAERIGVETVYFSTADAIPPAKRRDLILSFGNHAKRGKLVFLPFGKADRKVSR